jgi:hypothetical protein
MKTCPKCGTRYSDDTLSYCLQDGAALLGPVTDTPTVVLGETETFVPGRDAVRAPIGDLSTNRLDQSQVTHAPQPAAEKKGSKVALAVVVTAVGMLLLFGVIGLAAFVYFRNLQQAGLQNTNISLPVNNKVANANSSPSPPPIASPSRAATSEPRSTPYPSPKVDNDLPPPPDTVPYPATTRLQFGRGAVSTTFGALINPGDNRSLVLACRAGQSLTANVTSQRGCVTIEGGGSSLRTTTSSGDNYITLSNNCSSIIKFTIRITVI